MSTRISETRRLEKTAGGDRFVYYVCQDNIRLKHHKKLLCLSTKELGKYC